MTFEDQLKFCHDRGFIAGFMWGFGAASGIACLMAVIWFR